jgi:hypothetical protein
MFSKSRVDGLSKELNLNNNEFNALSITLSLVRLKGMYLSLS